MNYSEWETTAPESLKGDPLWTITAYRLAVFLGDVTWHDVSKLIKDRRTQGLSGQLYEAVGSISANLAEGYSRGGAKDRARFYEYSLGSARESRDWYFKSRHILGEDVVTHRMALITEIIRLLLTMIPEQRSQALKEPAAAYEVASLESGQFDAPGGAPLADLLDTIPMPEQ